MLNESSKTDFDRLLFEAHELLTEDERLKLSLELVPEDRDPKVEAAWIAESHRRHEGWKAARVEAIPTAQAPEQMFPKS